jgi:hypothetical protein
MASYKDTTRLESYKWRRQFPLRFENFWSALRDGPYDLPIALMNGFEKPFRIGGPQVLTDDSIVWVYLEKSPFDRPEAMNPLVKNTIQKSYTLKEHKKK